MEQIAHLEWTLGIGLIFASIWNIEVTALGFFLLGIGSVFPDLFDWFIFRGKRFSEGHRELSHTVYFLGLLILLSIIVPIIGYVTFGSILHIFEDVLAGRDYIYIFSPLTHRGGIRLITKEQSIKIGGFIRDIIKGSFLGSENIGNELSWFWFLTIVGSWFLIGGILMYFG